MRYFPTTPGVLLSLSVGLAGGCSALQASEAVQKEAKRGPCSPGASVKLITGYFMKENLGWHRLGGTRFGASQLLFKACSAWPLLSPAFRGVLPLSSRAPWIVPPQSSGSWQCCGLNLELWWELSKSSSPS